MAYPDLTFRDVIDVATRQELEQFVALLNGYLAVQHKDDGSHDELTADSATIAGTIDATGAISSDGNITADADGDPVITGAIVVPSGVDGAGLDMQGTGSGVESRWQLITYDGPTGGGSNHRGLAFQDVQSDVGKVPLNIWFSNGNFYISPTAATVASNTVYLGDDVQSSNRGRWPIFATIVDASTGYKERGRSTAMGEWTSVAHAGANFTASAGTWTVDSADQITFAYTLIGKTLIVAFTIANTDVSTTPTQLRIAIPGSFTAAKRMDTQCTIQDAGGTAEQGQCFVSAAGTTINIERNGGTAFTATSGDNTNVTGTIAFEVQ